MTGTGASAVSSRQELERSYDVEAGASVPTWRGFAAQAQDPVQLGAVYYDTRRGDLARRRITLRRREGVHDAGWHLKLPASDGRSEVSAALADDVPTDLAERVRGVLRGRRIWPVARIRTTRSAWILHDGRGTAVARFVDDLVEAVQVRGRVRRRWREWEVELLPDAAATAEARGELLDRVEQELVAAGARTAASTPQLARALGRDALGVALPVPAGTAIGEVLPQLAELIESCARRDPLARIDATDAVHQYRVDVRRIRSVLASVRDVLDPGVTEPLRRRLHRLQTELEPARDAEVRRASAAVLLQRGIRDPLDLLGRFVVARAEADHAAALERLGQYLDSRGYFRLLDELDLLVSRPPLGRRALRPATPVLSADLARQARRAARLLDAAAEDDLASMHDARKAVRRVRYLAEALTRTDGVDGQSSRDEVVRLGRAAKALQDELGDARDAELHAAEIEELADEAEAEGLDPTALHDAARSELEAASALLARVPEALREFEAARES